jgi:hypothetical protein
MAGQQLPSVPLAALVRFSEHLRFLQGRRSIVAQYLAFKIPLKFFSGDFLGMFALPTPPFSPMKAHF